MVGFFAQVGWTVRPTFNCMLSAFLRVSKGNNPCMVQGCALCLDNLSGRGNHKGHLRYVAAAKKRRELDMGKFVRKADRTKDSAARSAQATDDGILLGMGGLAEYLTLTAWEDGKPRKTATLLLFAEDGVWKCCLNDRENGRVTFRSSETIEELLKALSDALEGDEVDWRVSKGRPQK